MSQLQTENQLQGNQPNAVWVGVFWYIDHHVYGEKALVNAKTHAIEGIVDSPFEHWQIWEVGSKTVKSPVVRSDYEYFSFPRGRVLYDLRLAKHIVYCDQVLMNAAAKGRIAGFFGLEAQQAVWKKDLHYVTDEATIRGLFDDDL